MNQGLRLVSHSLVSFGHVKQQQTPMSYHMFLLGTHLIVLQFNTHLEAYAPVGSRAGEAW